MAIYKVYNGPAPTTVAQAPVTTGTSLKTLLQLSTPSTKSIQICAWGISFDGSVAATPVKCELVESTEAATVTAYVAADINKYDVPTGEASLLTLGTANSGYTASAEGSITTSLREFDVVYIAPTNPYVYQWPLGERPVVAVSKFLRIRVTVTPAVNAYCWVQWYE